MASPRASRRRVFAGNYAVDGTGSTFAPSLVEKLPDVEAFRRILREGQSIGPSVMQGFADDPNMALYVDDIHAYPQARADEALGRGRPVGLQQ